MKFWKLSLLTILTFFSVASIVLYSACTKDPCSTLTCKNGGSCASGLCHCASGYEGSDCSVRSISRYLGTYKGISACNQNTPDSDVVYILPTADSMGVLVIQQSNATDTLAGTVSTTESDGSIIVPPVTADNYQKNITISLNGNKLSIFSNEITDVANNVHNNCTFVGGK